MEFSGRLASFPIGDILQWADNDRRTGALIVRRNTCEKRIFLRDGEIVACFSDDAAEFFGQHLLVRGLIDEAALIRALTDCQERHVMLGRSLDDLGILSHGKVLEELRRHVEDQVCDIFLWKSGVFFFTTDMLPAEQLLPSPIGAVPLAMEGSRWSDELARIRRVFVHDNIVLRRGAKPPAAPSALERRILAAADGEMPLSELYNEVRGSFFRFLEASFRLTVGESLDVVAVGDHSDSHSTEIRLADLLIEQVTEEQSVFLRRHLAIPLDALERCVPAWVHSPHLDDLAQLHPSVREMAQRVDGETHLGRLLAGSSLEERTRRTDWLILQLRRGTLALLPDPVSKLESAAEARRAGAGTAWLVRSLGAR